MSMNAYDGPRPVQAQSRLISEITVNDVVIRTCISQMRYFSISNAWCQGLPSLADVGNLAHKKHKSTSIPDTRSSLAPSICSSRYWIVRVPFP